MLLQTNGISKKFDRPVLNDISFSMKAGSILSFLGPSGCGKSTLLRIIAGLEKQDHGSFSTKANLSFVFQDPLLLSWRTALDNVALPLEIQKFPRDERNHKALNSLEWVGLKDAAHLHPDALSGGMKMRVSLARALITNPDLLLLDEPFAALDELTRSYLNEELLKLKEQHNIGMILVTHNIFEAAFLSDRVLVLGGAPAQITKDLTISFKSPRTAQLRSTAEFAEAVGKLQSALRGTIQC
ncbi:MAG: hypothetical protein CMK59_04655 [Proteobacteria bacterium]|nr:hypothetical protein [Pseudomonadota bacterium]